MKIVKKRNLGENLNFDLAEQLKSVDFQPVIKKLNDMGIPVKKFEPYLIRGRISVEGNVFTGRDLGMFAAALKEARIQTFNSVTDKNNQGDYIWWATWDIRYAKIDGGTNGLAVLSTWYNFTNKTWEMRQEGQR